MLVLIWLLSPLANILIVCARFSSSSWVMFCLPGANLWVAMPSILCTRSWYQCWRGFLPQVPCHRPLPFPGRTAGNWASPPLWSRLRSIVCLDLPCGGVRVSGMPPAAKGPLRRWTWSDDARTALSRRAWGGRASAKAGCGAPSNGRFTPALPPHRSQSIDKRPFRCPPFHDAVSPPIRRAGAFRTHPSSPIRL